MKLINGEALEQLRLIPTKSIDFVCIDPPYELDNHGGGKTDFAQRKLVKDLHIDFISNGFDIEKIFTEIEKVKDYLFVGWSLEKIGNRYFTSPTSVARFIKRHNLKQLHK